MRFLKGSLAVAILSLAFAGQAKAFTAPTNITPFLPANNQATVVKVKTTATLDVYTVTQTGAVIAVPKGTALAIVLQKASLSWAWVKVLAVTGLTNSTSLTDLQAANTWFASTIAPLYTVPGANALRAGVRR
jgi:hypothetical protein